MNTLKEAPKPMNRFWRLLKPDRKEIVNVYVYAIFNGLVYLTLPLGIQAIINLIQVGSINTSLVLLVSVVIVGVAVNGMLQIFQLKITENLQQKIFARAAFDFAYRIPRLKLDKIYNQYAPELMNRFFDIVSVQKGLSKILIDFSTASVQLIVGMLILSLYHPFFIAMSLILILFLIVVFRYTSTKGLKTSLEESKYKYKIAYWLQELARANMTFKLSGNSKLPLDKTDRYVSGYIQAREKHFNVLLTQYSFMVLFKVIVALGLLAIGGLLVIERQMNIGQFVASEILVLLIMGAVEKLITTIEVVYDVLTSLEKLGQITDLELEDNKDSKLFTEGTVNGLGIEFNETFFKYPGDSKNILENVSFCVEPAEKFMIFSKEDLGSKALLYLASGLYKPDGGAVLFNGIPKENVNLAYLRTVTGDNLRKDMIFHGSIIENISMNRPQVDMADVIKVSERVELLTELRKYENGFDTVLNPDSVEYSEDFIQKIILARALVGNPKLLVLTDHFLKLSSNARSNTLDLIFKEFKDTTVLVASGNPELLQYVDKAIVLDKGKMSFQGKAQDVIKHLNP